MSLILKGIDLPKKWDILTLDIYSDGHGYASHEGEVDTMDVHAIQISKGHGRIIDEDEIYEQPHCGECNDATLDAIDKAPAILEAEE